MITRQPRRTAGNCNERANRRHQEELNIPEKTALNDVIRSVINLHAVVETAEFLPAQTPKRRTRPARRREIEGRRDGSEVTVSSGEVHNTGKNKEKPPGSLPVTLVFFDSTGRGAIDRRGRTRRSARRQKGNDGKEMKTAGKEDV